MYSFRFGYRDTNSKHMTMSSSFLCQLPKLASLTEKPTSITDLQQAHAHLLKTGLINDPYTATRLVAFAYTIPNPQTMSYAHSIFTHINKPTSFAWNSMIRAYANSSTPHNALVVFTQLLLDSLVIPDNYTYTFVIKACSAMSGLSEGKQVHAHVAKRKELRDNVYVVNTLIGLYASCGCFGVARSLLDRMAQRDVVSWNAILRAYVERGLMESARVVFDEMEERNVESWNFMVSGFAKVGLVEEARRMFDQVPLKDVGSWNAIVSGYANVGDFGEVLNLFQDMLSEDIKPENDTLVNVLSACANSRVLSQGEWVHSYIDKIGIGIGGVLAAALVDLYSKCGQIAKALSVFNSTLEKDVSTWNSMIGGLSTNGFGEEAVGTFRKMLEDDYKPNEITFNTVLSACSRAGLLIDGLEIFNIMIHRYEIEPTIEHYGCVVDLLDRVGLLKEAKEFLKGETPGKESSVLWLSLLSSCMNHSDLELAKDVTDKTLEMDPCHTVGYV